MKEIVAGIISAIVLVLALSWLAMGNEFFLYKVFAPRRAAVQREVFEQTKSYRQGMAQEIRKMMNDYALADDVGKATIRSVILHDTADVDESVLPSDVRAFVARLRSEQ